jgi:hypothetical protein
MPGDRMSEMVITLVKVRCDEVTDDFLEGLTDEFGWRLTVYDAVGKPQTTEEIPMAGMEAVAAGSEHTLNRELGTVPVSCHEAWLEFWDQDTFSEDDLLGRIEIYRDGDGKLLVSPGLYTVLHDDGSFNMTGHMGDYTLWLQFDER